MRIKLFRVLVPMAFILILSSCSTEPVEAPQTTQPDTQIPTGYTYSADEQQVVRLINDYRISIGLKALVTDNYTSTLADGHNDYMIANSEMSHANFDTRAQNLMDVMHAVKVGENVAYNYETPEGAVNAWLNSAGHKENIEGAFSHFGISITEDAVGRKYYTNIFIKIGSDWD